MKVAAFVFYTLAVLIVGITLGALLDGNRAERFVAQVQEKCVPRPGERTLAVNDGRPGAMRSPAPGSDHGAALAVGIPVATTMAHVIEFPRVAIRRPPIGRLAGRFGIFFIDEANLETRAEWVRSVMGQCIVLSARYRAADGYISYLAVSEQFDVVRDGEPAPTYFWRSGPVPAAERVYPAGGTIECRLKRTRAWQRAVASPARDRT